MATLTTYDGVGGGVGSLTGEALLEEIADFLEARLPLMSLDDPVRIRMAQILPALSRNLGRPPVRPVPRRTKGGE